MGGTRRTEKTRKIEGDFSVIPPVVVMMLDPASKIVIKAAAGEKTKASEGPPSGVWMVFYSRTQWCVTPLLGGLLLVTILVTGGCASSPQKPVEKPRPKQIGVYHTVKRHQTLWRICKTYNVDMAEVARINGIEDVNRIQAGQRIFMPGAKKVLQVDIYIEDLGPAGKKPASVDLATVKGRFIWPVRGSILKGFGVSKSRKHDGIDISAPRGTPIRSIDSGKVIYSGDEIRGYGNIVIIKHGPIFTSVYAHNDVNLIHEGDRVEKGQVIARVGRTGRATGSYLHFEIRNHNRPIDPRMVLP